MTRRRVGLALTIGVILVVVGFSTAAFARSHCERVYGTGQTFQFVPFGPFEGTAELNLGDAEVVVSLMALPVEKPDGTLHVWTSHAFDFDDDGGFVTVDKGVLAPTETPGLFNLNTRAKICATDCEGEIVRGAAPCGRLSVTGTMNLAASPPVADWRVRGKICDCAEE